MTSQLPLPAENVSLINVQTLEESKRSQSYRDLIHSTLRRQDTPRDIIRALIATFLLGYCDTVGPEKVATINKYHKNQ